MTKTFLIGDTHFGHSNILTFKKNDGTLLRDFPSIAEHDAYLIYRWNTTVQPEDKVYHMGDVGFTNFTRLKYVFDQLHGTKVLIKGNHDNFKLSQYQQIFKDVRAYHVLNRLVLSHIPIHPDSLARWQGNIHGHLHANHIADPRYLNVSVEQLNDYAPVDFNEVLHYYETKHTG